MNINPVDFWNLFGTWEDSIGEKYNMFSTDKNGDLLISFGNKKDFRVKSNEKYFTAPDIKPLVKEQVYSRFMILSELKFGGNYNQAYSFVEYNRLKKDIPYIRVGTDYFKVIDKVDRYGVIRKTIKGWKKDEIKQDLGIAVLKTIPKFDDFCLHPLNSDYEQIINNCYNLYAPFNHAPHPSPVTDRMIPVSIGLMKHIFSEQIEMGLRYLKILYENPRQLLPILCMVSRERQTGKTTFLNWMQMIFGDNFIQINPEDLSMQFNSQYATKNIIALDETVIDKSHAVEKLKSIATAKSISINQKFVANYAAPFFGKVIISTNKERDFMRIDEEEIRFWVRKVPVISTINTNIEDQLRDEIPMFLKYISMLPKVDFSKSRMVFTASELQNDSLQYVKAESQSGLFKELVMLIEDFFYQNNIESFSATAIDIKNQWFAHNNQISSSYIFKVIRDEIKINPAKNSRYIPFNNDPISKKVGQYFTFEKSNFVTSNDSELVNEELPF